MLDLVHLPVLLLGQPRDGVERHDRRPHKVAACLVILWVAYGLRGGVQQRTHHSLDHIVGDIVVLPRKVLLAQMGEGVKRAADHLVARQGVGQRGIHEGKTRIAHGAEVVSHLEALRRVGQDGAAVHLGARADHGGDGAYRQGLPRVALVMDPVAPPAVALLPRHDRNGLGTVDDGAAAHRQDEIHALAPRQVRTLQSLLIAWVGANVGQLHPPLAAGRKRGQDAVVQAAALDGAAAVTEQHGGAKGL